MLHCKHLRNEGKWTLGNFTEFGCKPIENHSIICQRENSGQRCAVFEISIQIPTRTLHCVGMPVNVNKVNIYFLCVSLTVFASSKSAFSWGKGDTGALCEGSCYVAYVPSAGLASGRLEAIKQSLSDDISCQPKPRTLRTFISFVTAPNFLPWALHVTTTNSQPMASLSFVYCLLFWMDETRSYPHVNHDNT